MVENKLTEVQIKNAKGKKKPYYLADGGGLNLYVTPKGTKYWRWRYRFDGKAQLYSIGEYDKVTLKDARDEHERLKRVLRRKVNPAALKKADNKAEAVLEQVSHERSTLAQFKLPPDFKKRVVKWPDGSFGQVTDEWFHGTFKAGKSQDYQDRVAGKLRADILPKLGHLHIRDIGVRDVVKMAKAIEDRGAGNVARNALMITGQIFRFAVANEYALRNPVADFRPSDALKTMKTTNMARIEPKDLPALLVAMHNDTGTKITWYALQIMARVFTRTTELRETPWSELDLDNGLWEIPGERMKNGLAHIVPLSRQVTAMFRELREVTGDEEYVFHLWNEY